MSIKKITHCKLHIKLVFSLSKTCDIDDGHFELYLWFALVFVCVCCLYPRISSLFIFFQVNPFKPSKQFIKVLT